MDTFNWSCNLFSEKEAFRNPFLLGDGDMLCAAVNFQRRHSDLDSSGDLFLEILEM